ncbi:MAG TPA: hypothetical protein VL485_26445 [Ktedonobacteraceae bacterium]|jgi:hypothetical protein|nr:hypothetical protein [Ktedonobacteraceae bacterium]
MMVGAGIIMDGALGLKLLEGITWKGMLLHLLVTLVWAVGIQLSTAHPWQAIWKMQRWSISTLMFALCTFPGFGICVYSGALCFMPTLWRNQEREQNEREQELAFDPLPEVPQEILPALDWGVQSLTETLHDANIEMKRVAMTTSELPEMNSLPLTLLQDAQNEVLSDASIVYPPIKDEPAQDLMDAFVHWKSDPDNKTLALDLIEQYYCYAHNDTLDRKSREIYLKQARDLLLHLLWHDNQNASLWIKLAQIRCELGELKVALQDALYALQLQPHVLDYALLAMSLAFRLHAWDTLVKLARDEIEQEELPVSLQLLKWWAIFPAENTSHGQDYALPM